jgi:hypothetical protein
VLLGCEFFGNACSKVGIRLKFLFTFVHHLSNVHTWAMFFLRHLANMSCMVSFWASTGSGFVHICGPRTEPRRPEEVVNSLNDSCSHFTQRLFPPKLPQQHTWIISYSICNIIDIFYTSHLHLLFTCLIYTFTSLDLHGRQAALGPLCPIQYHSWSWRIIKLCHQSHW